MKKNYIFYLLIFSLFLIISSPTLFSEGMFMDGLIYSSVSRNLSLGLGEFWNLHFTNTLASHFYGHPPVALGIQSVFFRVFGDSILIERFYSLITAIISGVLIYLICEKFYSKKIKQLAWVALLFWISIPLVFWAYSNNMLENTMIVFILSSFLFILNSLEQKRFLMLFLAGFSLFLAMLTKGLVALFPLISFFLYWIFFQKIKFSRMLIDSGLLFIFTFVPLILLLILSPAAKTSLELYFNAQIINSIQEIQTVNNRFHIIISLLNELIPIFILLIIIITFSLLKKIKFKNIKLFYKESLFFLTIGLTATLPLMITLKQRGFYLLPSFPFFAISFAFLIVPFLIKLNEKIKFKKTVVKIFKIITFGLLFVSIVLSVYFAGKIGRDNEKITDVKKIIAIVPENSDINICKELYIDWSLHGYFARYANISLDSGSKKEYLYLLTNKTCKPKIIENYQKIDVDLKNYELYKKRK